MRVTAVQQLPLLQRSTLGVAFCALHRVATVRMHGKSSSIAAMYLRLW
jgi:hypothetical protein